MSSLGINNCLHMPWHAFVERSSLNHYNDSFLALQLYCAFFTLNLFHLRPKWLLETLIRDVSRVDAQFDVLLNCCKSPMYWSTIFYQLTAMFLPFLIWSSNFVLSVIFKRFDLKDRGWCHLIRNLILFLNLTNFFINFLF